MSDAIKQLHASYSSLEDRILFTIETEQNTQILTWITRKYLKMLLPILQGQHPITGKSIIDINAQLAKSTNHNEEFSETLAKKINFAEHFEHPIGKDPILLTKISFKHFKTDRPLFLLEPEIGIGIMFDYNGKLLNTLTILFSQAMLKADWDFENSFLTQVTTSQDLLQ